MTESYRRITDLLDRWQASVDQHTRYLALDDAAYAKAEAWPKHQRPTPWVLKLARTRIAEIRRELSLRAEAGDPTFAESLELMSLLTTLLASGQVERFIPLATGKASTSASGTVRRPRMKSAESRPAPARNASRPAAPPRAVSTAQRPAPAAQRAAPAAQRPAPAPPRAAPAYPELVVATVVADAVRFLSWGREWPALAPSIARLADRPPEPDIARILRTHKALIEQKAGRPNL